MRLDLRDFFPSIGAGRVSRLMLSVGYPEPVARRLSALCTNLVPGEVFDALPKCVAREERRRLESVYGRPHLTQGAPTSPALANLCAFRLDCRLAGLAQAAGATYTRYADDLVFSGDAEFAHRAKRYCAHVAAIADEESFAVHFRKTRIMRQGVSQRVAGLVVNDRLNIPRDEYDRLKATLHNCVRFGPASQNRAGRTDFAAHLAGRIAYVASVHPVRGEKLRAIYAHIAW